MRRRIGFLFHHDQTHQIAHSLPIAQELLGDPGIEVVLVTTSPKLTAAVRAIGGDALARAELVELGSRSGTVGALASSLDRLVPARKLAFYGEHVGFFAGLDSLVVSEKSSLALRSHRELDGLKLIHTRHGAGDRAIGFGPESARFDLVLVSGAKIRDRLIAEAGVVPDRIRIVGYPKFDLYGERTSRLPLQANGRPTVLYTPHPSPKLSSWYEWGPAVLEAFASSDRFNLVFAPHVMLFERKWTVTVDPPAIARAVKPHPRFADVPNLAIDLGSAASSDMTYTNAADVYLGDASSQIYEFLLHPRPAVFLHPSARPWRGDANYTHFRAGPVLERIDRLVDDVADAIAGHADYIATQRELLEATFSVTDEPASRRAASAIAEWISARRAA